MKGEHPVPLNKGILVAKGRKTLADKPWPSRLGLSNRLTPYSRKTVMVTETSTGICITQPVSSGIVMTHYSQTHNVSTEGPNRLLTPRTTTKLGTWNVRKMFEAGRAQQIANKMSRYKVIV